MSDSTVQPHEIDATALADARESHERLFVQFQTVGRWSCALMEPVARLADGFVPRRSVGRTLPDAGRRRGVTNDGDEGGDTPRGQLARRIAGEITLSEDPGATLRKWRTDFGVSQTTLADRMNISSSVVSDYESGRRASPGIGLVSRVVGALLDIDETRGGDRIRQYARVASAGFESEIVRDIREYPTARPTERVYEAMDATELAAGSRDTVNGHTVIDSIKAITSLSSEEFYRLYGQSTDRALVFTEVTRGQSPLVALRVVTPTPNAVILHGVDSEGVWEHAPRLARADGFALAVSTAPLEDALESLRAI
ncbi:MAG: putative transcriptional regulator [halophilic archaeon J07HB67]|nr:MAG: putative transcriptional regulator [halophilic archaeon J07HB67]